MPSESPLKKVLYSMRKEFLREAHDLFVENAIQTMKQLEGARTKHFSNRTKHDLFRAGLDQWRESLVRLTQRSAETLRRIADANLDWIPSEPAYWLRSELERLVTEHLRQKLTLQDYAQRASNYKLSGGMSLVPKQEGPARNAEVAHTPSLELQSRVGSFFRWVCDGGPDFERSKSGFTEPWRAPQWCKAHVWEKLSRISGKRVAPRLAAGPTASVIRNTEAKFAGRFEHILDTAENGARLIFAASGSSDRGGGRDHDVATSTLLENCFTNAPDPKGLGRAILVEKIRSEIREIGQIIELPEDYDVRVRNNAQYKDYITVAVCNRHSDLLDKVCAIKHTSKPRVVEIACEIASRFVSANKGKPLAPLTYLDAHKRFGNQARKRLQRT